MFKFLSSIARAAIVVELVLISTTGIAQSDAPAGSICSVQTDASSNLSMARALFQDQCQTQTLTDCDPVNGGGWQCSSAIIGDRAPRENSLLANFARDNEHSGDDTHAASSTVTQAVPSVNRDQLSASVSEAPVCYATGDGLSGAKEAFSKNCMTFARKDCDPMTNERWVCSSANISASALFDQMGNSTDKSAAEAQLPPATVSLQKPTVSLQQSGNSNPPASESASISTDVRNDSRIGRLGSNDLLVLHYDNCPDPDDAHAIASAKAMVEYYGINNVMVANGTCGASIRDRFNPKSFTVIEAAWGKDYIDAYNPYSRSVRESAARWATTLVNGDEVWVAEAGQSDFTADIVRTIESQYPDAALEKIHIVQHSTGPMGFNERYTKASNLRYLKETTHYVSLADGNHADNGSADLNTQSSYFVKIARSSRFSTEWNAAFDFLPPDCARRTPTCKLDFSDTVELLYIVDDNTTLTVSDFANKYLK